MNHISPALSKKRIVNEALPISIRWGVLPPKSLYSMYTAERINAIHQNSPNSILLLHDIMSLGFWSWASGHIAICIQAGVYVFSQPLYSIYMPERGNATHSHIIHNHSRLYFSYHYLISNCCDKISRHKTSKSTVWTKRYLLAYFSSFNQPCARSWCQFICFRMFCIVIWFIITLGGQLTYCCCDWQKQQWHG